MKCPQCKQYKIIEPDPVYSPSEAYCPKCEIYFQNSHIVNFYWYCPSCKLNHQTVKNLTIAKHNLEIHEKEKHKGKLVGTFGKEFVRDS